MKQTDLSLFYHLGASLELLKEIRTGMEWGEFSITAVLPVHWLQRLLYEFEGVPLIESRSAAKSLLSLLQDIIESKDAYT